MDDVSRSLRDALVAALRPFLAARLGEREWPGLPEQALHAAEAWLAEALDRLLARPYGDQSRGPLEVFQEAMTGPTAALAAAGVVPPGRDEATRTALPGDVFDLAPASSAELGEEAWRAHIAWGIAKAAALARPSCGVLSVNLLDLDRIERAITAGGFRPQRLRAGDAGSHAVVFVDLEHPGADDVIRQAAERGARVVAFGPHVDDLAMIRARSLGAAEAVPRSRFFAAPGAFLPKYL